MLELRNIVKDYPAGGDTVHALRGVSLCFRQSEFVSILGQSGCGKTTMLNIIGGLDRYTAGDLIINGRSTKDFCDRDWDAYRNHSIGFVFQSYHLIPHQTVLANVELALSLSGIGKAERRARAIQALESVGLSSQMNKRPAEMSGGQMQRVAIARALVNDPEIILADEPTGALDSETSLQVMDILKEISKTRLVIMVTHNPELAEQYSTRTVRMLDGEVLSDSHPLTESEIMTEQETERRFVETKKREKMPSMSFFTSFGLSLRNLFTKKGRTILTSFAGSIGIIGIALIYAVSQGLHSFISTVQEDTLSSYPLTLESQHVDLGSLMLTMMGAAESKESHENDAVYQKPVLYDLVNTLSTIEAKQNDLKSFKSYLEEITASDSDSAFKKALNGVQYTYRMNLQIYTKNVDGNIILSDTQALIQELLMKYLAELSGGSLSGNSSANNSNSIMSMMTGSPSSVTTLWQEMLNGENGRLVSDILDKQYDIVYGSWPTAYNEVILVLDENNEIDDMTLYSLGLLSEEEMDKIVSAAVNKTEVDFETNRWSYKEICDMEFRTVLGADCFSKDEKTGLYTDLRNTSAGLKYLYDNGIVLKVSGIVRPNNEASSHMLSGTIGYTSALTEYVIEKNAESNAIAAQLVNPTLDIFSGLPFRDTNSSITDDLKEAEFRAYVTALDGTGKAEAYRKIVCIPDEEYLERQIDSFLAATTAEQLKEMLARGLSEDTGMSPNEIATYLESMTNEDLSDLMTELLRTQLSAQYAEMALQQIASLSDEQLAALLDSALPAYTTAQCAVYYDAVLDFSNSTYDANLYTLGYVKLDEPDSINLFASTFADKDTIEEMIQQYNEGRSEVEQIAYTDYFGIMMSSITTIIDAITYVLIAFVAVSLIVSSIMIGVITLISVQERTKEIGILRALGASKRNVSSLFNAETMIIGFTSGLLGVLITYLLCIPINLLLYALTDIAGLSAYLPLSTAIFLVIVSMLLTLFSGIIPSQSAAKKDPVVALRTE